MAVGKLQLSHQLRTETYTLNAEDELSICDRRCQAKRLSPTACSTHSSRNCGIASCSSTPSSLGVFGIRKPQSSPATRFEGSGTVNPRVQYRRLNFALPSLAASSASLSVSTDGEVRVKRGTEALSTAACRQRFRSAKGLHMSFNCVISWYGRVVRGCSGDFYVGKDRSFLTTTVKVLALHAQQ